MKRRFSAALFGLVASTFLAGAVHAASDAAHPKQIDWAFDGATGKVDRQAAQRGMQVYKQVCAACHGLKRVAFRTLGDIGFSEAEVKAFAESHMVQDGPNDSGDMFERAGRPSDYFVSPFPNDNAARAANNGALPPDIALIVKSRPDGANYLYSLLTGYQEAPADHPVPEGMYYNPYFPGGMLAMPVPLAEGAVEYQDGTPATVDQMAKDVTVFLQWAAEPEMEQRKGMGLQVLIYLAIATVLFIWAKKRVWSDVK